MLTVHVLFMILALIAFFWAAFIPQTIVPRVNAVALGLFFWVLAVLIGPR
jgi:hypothetical protein